MIAKPRSITMIGIVQVLLAASFVIWLLFFPGAGSNFAWPVTPPLTAMFIGTGFMMRACIGYFLWREKYWPKLRWQAAANYAFLIVIFVATYWHIDEMNWKSSILMTHIWVLAYTIEPIMLFLIEPRSPEAKAPLPPDVLKGPVFVGLKRVAALGLIVSATIGGLAFINPKFLDTRWPWQLDPFNARIMAAFFALTALWCIKIYFAQDWAEIRLAVLAMTLFAASNSIVWIVMLPQYDKARANVYTYGIVFALFAILFIYYFWRQESVRSVGENIQTKVAT